MGVAEPVTPKTRLEKRKACGIFMLQAALICFTRRSNKEAANGDKGGEQGHSTIINLSPSHTQNVSNFSASRFADDFCLPLADGIFPVPLKRNT